MTKILSSISLSFILAIFINPSAFAETTIRTGKHCLKADVPKVIKPMENYDIIATNTATIAMAPVFAGNNLTYNVSTHPRNKQNIVTINKQTGVIQVVAEKKDQFDITVKAKN